MNSGTKEKICMIYASDYHFEMVSLPYIQRNSNNKIIILTERNLEKTINEVLEKTNFTKEKKKKILEIEWDNNDLRKIREIKENIEGNKNISVFIKGSKNYIKNMNENLEKWIKKYENIKLIDCYNMEEISEDIEDIIDSYKKVLGTSGEKQVEKI